MPLKKGYTTAIPQQPVTIDHKPYIPKYGDTLSDPGTARANLAVSNQHPNGTTRKSYAAQNQHLTVIQQHVTYWDRDKDSIIWPRDTYTGCRDFGWSPMLAFFAALIIHFGLSYSTVPNLILPDPHFRIYVDRLYKAKHGSDSMTYDNQGRFRPQQFEDIFAKYDQGGKGGLDVDDLWIFWKDQRMVFDFFGWAACALEWVATYLLIWPADGILKKDDVRAIYDGSIFYKRAEETRRKRAGQPSPNLETSQILLQTPSRIPSRTPSQTSSQNGSPTSPATPKRELRFHKENLKAGNKQT
ncbi:MAG: hypothetical protein LQ352_004730 [Teloschistes flavicans]|nr:MAG: hypothetical protein LQ352_004730 [Teloschistes flavicans]